MAETAVETSRSTMHMFVSAMAWTVVYRLHRHYWPRTSFELQGRSVAALHAVAVIILSTLSFTVYDGLLSLDAPNTTLQYVLCITSIGYFIYDTAWCAIMNTEGSWMYIHHLASIGGIYIMIYTGRYGTVTAASIFINEVTNPLFQLSFFLVHWGKHNTWYAELNYAACFVGLGMCRVVLNSVLSYHALIHPGFQLVPKVAVTAIYLFGLYLFYMLIPVAYNRYVKGIKDPHAKP